MVPSNDERAGRRCGFEVFGVWCGLTLLAWAVSIYSTTVAWDVISQCNGTPAYAAAVRARNVALAVSVILSVKLVVFAVLALCTSFFLAVGIARIRQQPR